MSPWQTRIAAVRSLAARRPDRVVEAPAWLAVCAVACVVLAHGIAAWGTVLPHFAADEVSMVGNSLVIGRFTTEWSLAGGGYMPGLAILMAPVWWFTDSAVTVFHVGLGINVALAGLAVWPLAVLARWAGAQPRMAIVLAAVVSIAPARLIPSNYLMAESLLVLTSAAALVAGIRLSARPSWRAALLFGFAVGAVFLSHGRGIGLVAGAGAWALLSWRRLRWNGAIAALSVTAASALAYALFVIVAHPLYDGSARESLTWDNVVNTTVGYAFATGMGQLWYAAFAWPAIAILGAALLVRRTRTGQGGGALLILLVTVSTFAVSVTQTYERATPTPRLDPWIYGRYVDHLWVCLAVIGLAVLTRVRWAGVALAVVGSSALVCGVFLWVTAPQTPVGGWWVDVHVAGLAPFLDLEAVYQQYPEAWLRLSVLLMLFTVVVLCSAWVRSFHVIVLAVLWLSTGMSHDLLSINARDERHNAAGVDPYDVGLIPADARLGIIDATVGNPNLLVFTAWPREVGLLPHEALDDAGARSGVDVIFVGAQVEDFEPEGARLFAPTADNGLRAWVLPGEVFDRLEGNGQLVQPEATTPDE